MHWAGRFPEPPAGDFFLSLAAGEGEARSRLGGFAAAVGLGEQGLRAYEQARRAMRLLQAYRLLDWDTLAEGF